MKSASQILQQQAEGDEELLAILEEETLNARIAMMIYQARQEARLTQKQLAEKIGTKQPVIARLERADYEGHSLSMLAKIATALGLRLDVRLTPSARPKGRRVRSRAKKSG